MFDHEIMTKCKNGAVTIARCPGTDKVEAGKELYEVYITHRGPGGLESWSRALATGDELQEVYGAIAKLLYGQPAQEPAGAEIAPQGPPQEAGGLGPQ